MSSFTVSSQFVKKMLEGAERKGCDITPLLVQAGISVDILEQQKSRITSEQFGTLARLLILETQDIAMGLLDSPQKLNFFKVLTHYAIRSKNLKELFRAVVEFLNLFDNSFLYEFLEGSSECTFRLSRISGMSVCNSFVIEYILVTIHRLCCWQAGRKIPIKQVTLDYAPPIYQEEYRYLFFGATVVFEQENCSMSLCSELLDSPCVQNADSLQELLKNAPISLLTQTLSGNDMLSKVRIKLETKILKDHVIPNLEEMSEYLGLNPQTLRRRLKAESSSYHEIKKQVRRDVAITLLNDNKYSVEKITFLVGFSEPSTFIRAFKAWTGLTPLTYRKSATNMY